MGLERTLVIVKPDGVQRALVGPILTRLEARGLKIVGLKLVQVSPDLAARHYAEHEGKGFYAGLLKYITSAPVVVACVEGTSAVQMVRNSVGATNPLNAAPGHHSRRPGAGYRPQPDPRLGRAGDGRARARAVVQRGELVSYARDTDRWIFE